MPTRETVDAFVAQVLRGEHVEAIRDWYAEDASMQENQQPPRAGRETLMAGEARTLARVAAVKTELLAPPLVDGDRVAIHWRFTFTSKAGEDRSFEEIALQTWRGDKVWREVFWYDPAQMTG
ncbi:MAG: nuclear transport factor 2 family protein [Phenylobacterium sp.]|uniref:nuclear transport factor 2 family protein n=1 Tax=Phenylobacterium sp. TaxID=1871053 RepID=UPI001A4E035A|nr:nuclear transport factor 2 family protein [Phenylobacterium sp.]MBL8769878.1 nuclear transport factor 2 family protein [Phenylobacterium sp.]